MIVNTLLTLGSRFRAHTGRKKMFAYKLLFKDGAGGSGEILPS